MAQATALKITTRAQGFGGISVSGATIPTDQLTGTERVIAYLQMTYHGEKEMAANAISTAEGAHCHGAVDQANLTSLGIKPEESGVAKVLIKAFPGNSGNTPDEANYSMTLRVMDVSEGYEGPTVTKDPSTPAEAKNSVKLGRLAYVSDDRALLRGVAQGPLYALFDQIEVRCVTMEVNGENEDWLQVVGITQA
jgi:hypothetical protein